MPSAPLAVQENALSSVFVWSLVLVAAVIGGFWVVTILKRRLQSSEDDQPASMGFSLSDLREMHRAGQLSDEEFERARTKMAASLKKDLKPPPVSRQDRPDRGGAAGGKSV